MPKLYGQENLVFNVHTLLHLIQDVKRHGSLSQHSMFALESSLGYFKKKIHGTTSLSSQFIKGIIFLINLSHVTKNLSLLCTGVITEGAILRDYETFIESNNCQENVSSLIK